MSIVKQERLINILSENTGYKTMGEALIKADYSISTARNPYQVLESKSFIELCLQHGLTKELIVDSLVADIKSKPRRRAAELNLGAKILRLTEEQPVYNLNQYNFDFDDDNNQAIQTTSEPVNSNKG